MADTLLLIVAAGAAYLGFALFALSQSRHWQQVAPSHVAQPPQKKALRLFGCMALAVSLSCTCWRDGPAFGPVLWLLLLSVAAPLLVFTLSWRPHWLRRLAQRLATRGRNDRQTTTDRGPMQRG